MGKSSLFKEQFNIAYLKAIAAQCNLMTSKPEPDWDKIDIIFSRRTDYSSPVAAPSLQIQAKATVSDLPCNVEGFSYSLDIETYNNLRHQRRGGEPPRILVVLRLPREQRKWTITRSSHMRLHHRAFWVSLEGLPAVDNKSDKVVQVPWSQPFTPEEVESIFDRLAAGGSL